MDEVLHTTDGLYSQVAELIQGARKQVATQVNSALLATYWNVARLIVEDEQRVHTVPNMASRCCRPSQSV